MLPLFKPAWFEKTLLQNKIELLLTLIFRFGADPNTNIKGTRPLHEAIDGGSRAAVRALLTHGADPLIYDYSGNMPIDLAEAGKPAMSKYLRALLNDLHGKPGLKWNVASDTDFSMPPDEIDEPGRGSKTYVFLNTYGKETKPKLF